MGIVGVIVGESGAKNKDSCNKSSRYPTNNLNSYEFFLYSFKVKFGTTQPHTNGTNGTNGTYANNNPQGLLNGTPNSTPTGTPPEYERAQPNFNIFQVCDF